MSTKRRNTSSPECENSPKRLHIQPSKSIEHFEDPYDDLDESETDERPQIDAYTGQTGAFPGLGSGGEDLFYGPANDGLDYLRMVRSEAKGIPQLLRACVGDISKEGSQDEAEDGGYWDHDGTYTALPEVENKNLQEALPRAQIEYYNSLLAQFTLLQATLRCVPPLSAIEKLTSLQPISFPAENKNARSSWAQCLETREPNVAQIACMDENSVFQLVKLLARRLKFFIQDEDARSVKRTSTWIWAALGKCPDGGQLGSEEVSTLRSFAQECISFKDNIEDTNFLIQDVLEGEVDDEDEDGVNGKSELQNGLITEIEAAKTRLAQISGVSGNSAEDVPLQTGQSPLDVGVDSHVMPLSVKQEKFIALDMVVTVVGEVYGQRDLLELRRTWNGVTAPLT